MGTWIGVHSEWDTDFTCPLATYIQLDADSTYHFGMVDGSAGKRTSTWAFHGESMRLDTIRFAPGLVSIQNNLLRIGANYPMVFRRFTDVAIDSILVHKQLSGRVWQSDSLTIYFYTDGKVALENPATKQRTAHYWQVKRFGQSIFLVIQGNQYTRDRGYKPLWQIVSLSPHQLQATGWNGCAVAKETFRLVRNLLPGETCRPNGFQPCSNCFSSRWREGSLSRSDKRYDLVHLFRKTYQPISQPGESGLIRIRFVVNCEGEQGLFELRGFDESYCPRMFNPQITNQLVAICRNQVATDPSLRKPNNPDEWLLDVAVSLTFRLQDGRLTDILP
ncbi:hypothetical protein [Spirosoma validum]|uniref:Uncharacterized protein n=1 Tax=Spirosoma validum TaxID=2771355 RepID=A0A927AY99_9BACT|nr:hypothetical protein [Spirosoma validum]MBD2751892.1 hypothetical protein [Spirosoma validum]